MTPPVRGTDVWLREDLRNILHSLARTAVAVGAASGADREYLEGWRDAVVAMELALGLRVERKVQP